MTRTSELGSGGGIHFKDPWEFRPYFVPAGFIGVYNSGGTTSDDQTAAMFTEMARRGLQDTTNWTAGDYKTLLNVSSGKGFVACVIGPVAGGASTTTFEFTIDGVLTEIAVGPLASGERAALLTDYYDGQDYTTAANAFKVGAETLESDKATFASPSQLTSVALIPGWRWTRGTPLLKFKQSLLIRAKHSASITNSTATAYSAVMYRLGL